MSKGSKSPMASRGGKLRRLKRAPEHELEWRRTKEILWLMAIIVLCVIGCKAVRNSAEIKGAANEVALAAANPQIVSAFRTVENLTPA